MGHRITSNEEYGEIAERKLKAKLDRYFKDPYYYNYHSIDSNYPIILPHTKQENCMAQIDHLIISSSAVFVIETKAFGGAYILEDEDDERNWLYYYYYGTFYQKKNPIHQNYSHIQAIKDIFKDVILLDIDIPYVNIVCMVSTKREKWEENQDYCDYNNSKNSYSENFDIGDFPLYDYRNSHQYTCSLDGGENDNRIKEIIDSYNDEYLSEEMLLELKKILNINRNKCRICDGQLQRVQHDKNKKDYCCSFDNTHIFKISNAAE